MPIIVTGSLPSGTTKPAPRIITFVRIAPTAPAPSSCSFIPMHVSPLSALGIDDAAPTTAAHRQAVLPAAVALWPWPNDSLALSPGCAMLRMRVTSRTTAPTGQTQGSSSPWAFHGKSCRGSLSAKRPRPVAAGTHFILTPNLGVQRNTPPSNDGLALSPGCAMLRPGLTSLFPFRSR